MTGEEFAGLLAKLVRGCDDAWPLLAAYDALVAERDALQAKLARAQAALKDYRCAIHSVDAVRVLDKHHAQALEELK